jgi:hypothetical protein
MTFRSNPRILIFYSILVALPLGALALYQRVPQIAGGLILAASLFVDYKLLRFAQPYLKTKIITAEPNIRVYLAGKEETFAWEEVTLSGKCEFRGRPFVFLYHLGRDRIITIPYEYSDMSNLEKTLMEKTPYEIFPPGVDIRRVIYERYHTHTESPPGSA